MGPTPTDDDRSGSRILDQIDIDDLERNPAPGYRCAAPECEDEHEHERVCCAVCGRYLGYIEVSNR